MTSVNYYRTDSALSLLKCVSHKLEENASKSMKAVQKCMK